MTLLAIVFVLGVLCGAAGVWLVLAALVNRIERESFGARSHSPEDGPHAHL